MADAITWRLVNEEQVASLAQRRTVDECKSELAQIFKIDIDDKKRAFLLDLHHFQPDQISVQLGIVQSLIDNDFTRESTSSMESSYGLFQSLLLAHSVDRSPKRRVTLPAGVVRIFSPGDVNAIVDFVAHSYYRHFHLHKCIFTPFYHTHLTQRQADGVQLPARPRPLCEAFLHPQEEQPAPGQPADDTAPGEHSESTA